MSEREVGDAARRKGRRARQDGEPLSANPMRSRSSRYNWENAWLAEQTEQAERERIRTAAWNTSIAADKEHQP